MTSPKSFFDDNQINKMQDAFPEVTFLRDEPMSRHTSFRIGGPADLFVSPTEEQLVDLLSYCKKRGIPYTVFGNGSNVLVADEGIEGLVLVLGRAMGEISVKGCTMTAGAGAPLADLSRVALEHSLEGLAFTSGIPGTVGGAVYMNAGAYGGDMASVLSEVRILTKEGKICNLPASELALSYRHSKLMETEAILLSATFLLAQGEQEEIREEIRSHLKSRREKQPLEYPSAGSTFKRPEGYFAGKLIEDAGLRGYRVGDAAVSEKHCGFVVNLGAARASDVCQLMQEVRRIVEEKFGVTLAPEVRLVGRFSDAELDLIFD